ncbi:MAG: outer membrane beta-barrel protein, partial [Acidobacteriota bacterium]
MTLKGLLALLVGVALGAEGVGFAWGQVVIVTPSLTVSEEYDDNVFLSSTDRQSDFLTVVSPGLRLESRGHPWDVTLAGSVRGEAFAERSELNNFADAWQASATVELRPTRLLNV